MRRLGLFFLLLAALAIMLSACAPLVESAETQRTWQIYATFYPIYALTSLVTEDIEALETHCLVQPQDGCLRDYALSEWDLYMLLQADVVVSGGRGLESFESTLQSLGDNGPVVVFANYNYELYNQDDAIRKRRRIQSLGGRKSTPFTCLSPAQNTFLKARQWR